MDEMVVDPCQSFCVMIRKSLLASSAFRRITAPPPCGPLARDPCQNARAIVSLFSENLKSSSNKRKKERKKERKKKRSNYSKSPPKKFKEEEEKRKKRIIISLLPKIGQKCNKIGANAGPVRLDPCQIPNGTFLARDPSQILARLQRVDGQLQPPDNWHPAKSCRFPDSFDFSLSGMLEASWKILPASFFEFPCPFE